ncbi:hypothetical protein LTR53_000329 [Teratosphaeriaceae sp. CCFEE 6253]|nr:hypothetical protein LTR53_000329 [Teratosphaeriaceae sp. CCFEE 6253]
MTRRIVRTLTQAAAFLTLILILVFIADSRYRVLPTSIHDRLPTHHAGTVITDITISTCSTVNPLSTCRLDPDVWHRVEKDLYLHSGWVKSAWLHVKRKKEEELSAGEKVVVGVRVGRLDPGVGEQGKQEERWESRPGGLWLLRSTKRHDSDSAQAVTSVDVLFGADAVDPRPGWKLAQTPLLLDTGKDLQVARLSARHGWPSAKAEEKSRATDPRVNKDGKFKILQLSDAHLSTGTGVCRDAIGEKNEPSTNCEADIRTLDFIETILDDEKPDLVVLSGDQVEGPTAPDTQSALFKLAAPLIERGIPYAAIFGNHDDEGALSLSRAAQMSLLQTLPHSLSHPGPKDVAGVGNYYIEVLAPSPSQHSALTIYLLDTHGLTPDEKKYKGYDWLKPSQISWFETTAAGLRKAHAKYSHIHLDMAFIHIPLPEYAEDGLVVKGGDWREGVTAPKFNSHFYDALSDAGIVAIGCGHDHVNDYCALRPAAVPISAAADLPHGHRKERMGPWMCYAGASGFGGYAGYGGNVVAPS